MKVLLTILLIFNVLIGYSQNSPLFVIDVTTYKEGIVLIRLDYGIEEKDTVIINDVGNGHLLYKNAFKMRGTNFKVVTRKNNGQYKTLEDFSNQAIRQRKSKRMYQHCLFTSFNGSEFIVLRIGKSKLLRSDFNVDDPKFEEMLANFK